VESPVVLKNRIGEVYIFYITNGGLVVLKQHKDEDLFFNVEPVKALHGLNNFSEISVTTWPSYHEYLFFIAEKDGQEGLYTLTFDDEWELVLLTESQLTLDRLNGRITKYVIKPDIHLHFFYMKGNTLACTIVSRKYDSIYKHVISGENEQVKDFSVYICFEDNSIKYYGLYMTEHNGHTLFHYFEVSETAVLKNEVIHKSETPHTGYQIYVDRSGNTHFDYIEQNNIYGKKNKGNIWTEKNNGRPLADLSFGNIIDIFYKVIPKGRYFNGYLIDTQGKNNMYIHEQDSEGNISGPVMGSNLNKGMITGDISYFNVYADIDFYGCIEEIEGNTFFTVYQKPGSENTSVVLSEQVTNETIEDVTFVITSTGKVILYKIHTTNNNRKITYHTCNPKTYQFELSFSMEITEEMGMIKDIIFEKGLCGIIVNEKAVWIDTEHWVSRETGGGSGYMFLKNNDNENEYIYYIKEGKSFIQTWNVPVFSGEFEEVSPVEEFIIPFKQEY
jgi:hypothetical protein